MTPRLECAGLTGGYGTTTAFRDVDLALEGGTIEALLGPNGAGKTTLLLTLAGFLPPQAGTVTLDGTPLKTGRPAPANKAGMVLVPDNRNLFTTLTVEENLRAALSPWWSLTTRHARRVPSTREARGPAGRRALRRRATDARHGPRAHAGTDASSSSTR